MPARPTPLPPTSAAPLLPRCLPSPRSGCSPCTISSSASR
uniref:Uncharacterized protein n=1 Tax=Arundo donax TaxID=35708 RepID=A0A0A8YDL9_ARUDO